MKKDAKIRPTSKNNEKVLVKKNKMSKNKINSNKNIKKNNLYDLEHTLDINIEIIKTFFKNTTTSMTLFSRISDPSTRFLLIFSNEFPGLSGTSFIWSCPHWTLRFFFFVVSFCVIFFWLFIF